MRGGTCGTGMASDCQIATAVVRVAAARDH
jgi:hypothetical protein